MSDIKLSESHVRSIYEVLCGVSFWMETKTTEGAQVKQSAIRELRMLEHVLQLPQEERLGLNGSVPCDHGLRYPVKDAEGIYICRQCGQIMNQNGVVLERPKEHESQ